MGISHYPNGFANGVSIRGLPILTTYAGNVFWVNSATGSNSNRGTREKPFSTLDYAIGRCTANQGDVIFVAPNHAETITGAGGITADIAGISIIGLGTGLQRPRFLMDGATTVTFLISAADVYVSGLDFASGHSNVVTCFNVTATGAHIDNCKFGNNTTNEDFLVCISASGADNTADGLTVTNCQWFTTDTDDDQMISFTGSAANVSILGNRMQTASTATAQLIVCATGKLLTNTEIGWNICQNLMTANELFISNDGTTNSGTIHNNYSGHADVTTTHDNGWSGGGWRLFNNLSASTDAVNGGIIPAVDTDA